MSRFDALFSAHLQALEARHARRHLRALTPADGPRVWRDGRQMLNFCSNDYLGLSRHPLLVSRACQWAGQWGAGSGASRLVTGTLELHEAVEARLARLKGTPAALLFNSGWQANASILPALFHREALEAEPLVFTDRLNHASLHHGCQAAGVRQVRFRHNDPDHLETLLRAHAGHPGRRFIITESVFSMDGDCAPVAALAALAARYDAFLYLDEAHATGVLGPGGMGLSGLVPEGRVDLVMGTFSKALGGFGAYVACSETLREYLINRASGFIYATALPPAVLGAMDAALELVPTLDESRQHLHRLAFRLRQALVAAGYPTGATTTQIIPALVGSEARALAVSRALEAAGILASAIRPPTVPPGTARLRFTVTAAHTAADLDRLLATLPR